MYVNCMVKCNLYNFLQALCNNYSYIPSSITMRIDMPVGITDLRETAKRASLFSLNSNTKARNVTVASETEKWRG